MALTSAERQAAFKARKAETLDALAHQNAALLAEVAELRAEVDRLREKAHRLEVSASRRRLPERDDQRRHQPKVQPRQWPESQPHQPNAHRNDKPCNHHSSLFMAASSAAQTSRKLRTGSSPLRSASSKYRRKVRAI